MSQEHRQQAARKEKLAPSTDRVKISATNMRIKPIVPKKEETFQVILDIIKASPCFKAFTITTDVPEIYMRKILNICRRGLLDHLAKMLVDHMHQQWRTLATIINKCLSGKTSSNDRLRQSRVAIFWGMFHKENVDYPELI
ncbi:hypothetical protein Tco_1415472 [Tanacetum coccineum]